MKKYLAAVAIAFASLTANAYTTACIANTDCTNAGHVGNAARSMIVDSNGLITTASNWDENNGYIQQYQNGVTVGSVGAHGGGSGSALGGNASYYWTACQFNAHAPVGQQNGCVFRTLRTSPYTVDTIYNVSSNNTERYADLIGGINVWGQFWAASSIVDKQIKVFNTSDTLLYTWPTTGTPGAITFDRNGNIWVAQGNQVVNYARATGTVLATITLNSDSNVTALYFDAATAQLIVADSGPDEALKYYNSSNVLVNTVAKGFRDIKGVGKDSAGNTYVLSVPWGGNFDLGRTGGTYVVTYDKNWNQLFSFGGYNFEGNAAYDPVDGRYYSGLNIYTDTGYAANTVDPHLYPNDPRMWPLAQYAGRDMGFAKIADINGNRILVTMGQNPDSMYQFHFNGNDTAIYDGTPFQPSGSRIRAGFDLSSNGDAWASYDRPTNVIYHYPLIGFDGNGKPSWGAPISMPVPATMTNNLGRLKYLPESDTMILIAKNPNGDWTSMGSRVEVYHNWTTNQTNPLVINLNVAQNPKTMSAAGNYLFIGYVHTVPNIDAFNLTTGTLDQTYTTNNSTYVGNDVDSMYGLDCRYTTSYICTKDNYNGNSVVVYKGAPQ